MEGERGVCGDGGGRGDVGVVVLELVEAERRFLLASEENKSDMDLPFFFFFFDDDSAQLAELCTLESGLLPAGSIACARLSFSAAPLLLLALVQRERPQPMEPEWVSVDAESVDSRDEARKRLLISGKALLLGAPR